MLRSDRLRRLQSKLRIVGPPRALRAGCLRGTCPLVLLHLLAFLLANFGKEIR
jgi:hypothetical protein